MSGGRNHSNHYVQHNHVRMIHGGKEYFQLLGELIDRASASIHLQMYIFNDDKTGQEIAGRLIQASTRGVAVYMIVDGYASQRLSRKLIRGLKQAGVHFRFFEPLLKSKHFYFGRRMHHKTFVADEKYALIGGVNIADRYNDFPQTIAWLDMALYLEGEIVHDIVAICRTFWDKQEWPPLPSSTIENTNFADDPISVRIRQNDFVKGKHQIWRSYFDLFRNSREKITIMCSYFLPGRRLRQQLGSAAARGVQIKVILAGPSDVSVAKYAERYLYQWMMKNKIEIFEYQPTVLHAKITVVDEHWVTIGSYNVNNISAYASIELNADIRNKPFAQKVQQHLDEIILKDCIGIRPQQAKFPFLKRMEQKISYEFIRMVLNLFTFYFKREE